ncbi:hypothetical protein BFP71_13990 [Roseivirga misakiensis]|uniref:Uncharacterized protein n=1 Tax=Roseivirga misakiensis TaxID=1563681 RepID=A0A1E5SZM0_9BACT|nr:hypothetical protein BFP71_13990 [Roseivirga misakiensis]
MLKPDSGWRIIMSVYVKRSEKDADNSFVFGLLQAEYPTIEENNYLFDFVQSTVHPVWANWPRWRW